MSEKVYCKGCKWYRVSFDEYGWDECRCPELKILKHNYDRSYYVNAEPKEVNKDNNCKHWKRKLSWGERIAKWFSDQPPVTQDY